MEAVGQAWNEIAKHVGGGWKSVQQENVWRRFGAGFTIKDLVSVYSGRVKAGHR